MIVFMIEASKICTSHFTYVQVLICNTVVSKNIYPVVHIVSRVRVEATKTYFLKKRISFWGDGANIKLPPDDSVAMVLLELALYPTISDIK